MSEVVSSGNKIHSFEPMYCDVLIKNINDNKKQNIIIPYNCGLGESNYQIKKPDIDL
jgi:hypothetical protein